MSKTCPHALEFNFIPPSIQDALVHKEECTRCFDNQASNVISLFSFKPLEAYGHKAGFALRALPSGIDVCLTCFNGGCTRPDKRHAELHSLNTSHTLTLNIKKFPKPKEDTRPAKQSRLEVVIESEEVEYDYATSVRCWKCQIDSVDTSIDQISKAVDFVMQSMTANLAKAAKAWAWDQFLAECQHSIELQQSPHPEFSLDKIGTCSKCEKSENLWMCLVCGHVGCGRKQYDGSGGNNHAVEHYEQTGHHITVKLGTITPNGTGDVMCYLCDDMCKLPQLKDYVKIFGIDVNKLEKTDKSMAEMQIEYNEKYQFSMTTEDGKQLEPLYGPGVTGLKNIGNSCYMASVIQCLFHLKAFRERYFDKSGDLDGVAGEGDPTSNVFCQLLKLADGIWSGRYSERPESNADSDANKGIPPNMFKDVIAKDHPDFSTMQQQDAYEFYQYFTKQINQNEFSVDGGASNPTKIFDFELEERLECVRCQKVRYSTQVASSISLDVPKRSTGQDEDGNKIYEEIDVKECFDLAFAPTAVEGYHCPSLSVWTVFGISLTPGNINSTLSTTIDIAIPLVVPEKDLNLEPYRGHGQRPGEELLPEDSQPQQAPEPPKAEIDEAALAEIMSMGFPEVRCRKALIKTNNTGSEAALNWLFEHMDDPDIDVPEPAGSSAMQVSVDPANISSLCDMGFTEKQAKKALRETDNNMERAIEWLFSHPDDPCDDDDTSGIQEHPSNATPKLIDDGIPGVYELSSFISHKGKTVHFGHYVAHVRNPGPVKDSDYWALFNDEKVVVQPNPPISDAYIYVFTKKGANAV
ncbi:ubiquitin C-terminal hydrolase Ubp14 [Mycoemilia scoparia]|uniref:Ubiquitin carboxyl-terminal hydrolase n=1 Tax=Mycoemilia scoparia TaxID=417184 RepID=A0A9W8AAA5_9FUNG|nr:ubiquitin C-terminal hydrolase Ubp14 [Mycoemilia scoparia]